MGDNYSYLDEARARQQYSDTSLDSGYTQSLPPTTEGLASAYSILGSGAGYMGGSDSSYAQAMQTMQSTYGNHALQRFIGQPVGGSGGYLPGQGVSTINSDGGMQALTTPGGNGSTPGLSPLPSGGNAMGWQRPQDGTGGFAFWEYQGSTPMPGLGIPIHDIEAGFGFDLDGTTLFGGNMSTGTWDDGLGGTMSGGKIGAGVVPNAQFESKNFHPLIDAITPDYLKKVDVQALAGNMEASWGDHGAALGAELDGFQVNGTFGEFTGNNTTEQTGRFGLGVGMGASARLHWGDSDGDGYQEFGYGLDAGPASIDFKSEDPLRSLLTGGPFNPLNAMPDWMNPSTYVLPEEGNLTYQAMDKAGGAMESVHNTIMDGGNAVGDWLKDWTTPDDQGLEPISPPSGAQLMPEESIWY